LTDEDLAAVAATPDPDGALELGRRLQSAGKSNAARAAFEKAMKSSHVTERATAALLLAELLNKQRDFPGAERAYEAAVETGQPDVVPVAAFGLGWLRSDSGDVDGALAAFNITLESGHQRFAGHAANQIGDLLLKCGDRTGARAVYAKAVAFHSDAVAAARGRLRIAQLDYKEGRHEHAMSVIKDLARSAPKAVALAASFQLGLFHTRRGETEDARRAFAEVLESGDPIWVEKANRAIRELREH
jgi:tetratricopeptide (TPR) repeat protein